MAIRTTPKGTPQEPMLDIELSNGDLKALDDVVKKWKFKNREAALKFALAVLITGREKVQIHLTDEQGGKQRIVPADELVQNDIES